MKLLLLFLLIATPLAEAKQIPDASENFVNSCRESTDCELRFFTELSKTFRPSRKESELRDYVLAVKDTAEKLVWKQKLETFRDPIGNLMIRLPATGAYVGKNKPSFALQAHMDMVLAYVDAKPGEDLEPYFKDGVTTEIKNGWIQAKNNRTTLGADNGIGVAIELRYLVDNRIAHPPLELIFTVQEEIGLFGAAQFEIPILSQKMLCLDGMTPEEGMIIAGSQGGHSEVFHFNSTKADASLPGQDLVLSVSVMKMAGGHSGGDIHRGRTNALKLFGALLEDLGKNGREVRLKSVTAGDGILNKIPNLFQAEILVPAASAEPDLADHVKSFLLTRISQNKDDLSSAEVAAHIDPAPTGTVGTSDFSRFLANTITAAPNGVIDQDPTYFNGVYTSNNIASLRISSGATGNLSAEFGFMARSFSDQRMSDTWNWFRGAFSDTNFVQNFSNEVRSSYSAWIEPESSSLMQEVLNHSGYFTRKFYLPAGLEPSAFKQRIPTLEVIALGPVIMFAHSVNEKMKLESIPRTIEGVKRIVQMQ